MDTPELAAEYMRSGYNCAQSIVKAFSKEVGLDNDEIIRMAASLGGGMGRNGYVCGAVTGSALIIGRKYGNTDPSDTQSRDKAYEVTNKLIEAFQNKHRTVLCKELISADMKNPQELEAARENGIFKERCPVFVLAAGNILAKLLLEE